MSDVLKFKGNDVLTLDHFINSGDFELGRGNIISKIDIRTNPGPFPIYSSSAQNNGLMGKYGEFMFDEELISWSIDGGGRFFFRSKHRFSVTNVSGYLLFKSQIFDPKFVYNVLDFQHQHLSFDYQTKAHPSVIREMYFIPVLPIEEQQKIASILTSVDEVIENTQAQIAKLEDLKKATMNDLLTKGIGHTEFKDTEIGRIPKSWTGSPLEDMLIEVIDGDRGKEYPKDYDLSQKGYCLFLSAKNVTKKGFQFADLTYISREKDQKLRKGKAARNDIVITTRGTVGNIAIYDSLVPFNDIRINSGMALIRNKDNTISTEYLYHLLSSDLMARQIKRITFGSAQPQLTIKTIKELALPIPPTEEQDKISIIATTLTNQISALEKKHYSLANIKKALMQDLLTGKVRVQVN